MSDLQPCFGSAASTELSIKSSKAIKGDLKLRVHMSHRPVPHVVDGLRRPPIISLLERVGIGRVTSVLSSNISLLRSGCGSCRRPRRCGWGCGCGSSATDSSSEDSVKSIGSVILDSSVCVDCLLPLIEVVPYLLHLTASLACKRSFFVAKKREGRRADFVSSRSFTFSPSLQLSTSNFPSSIKQTHHGVEA